MADDPVPVLEKILSDVDATMRRRLNKFGLDETDRLILAIAPDGSAVIRCNRGPEILRAMADLLVEIADEVQEPRDGKLN